MLVKTTLSGTPPVSGSAEKRAFGIGKAVTNNVAEPSQPFSSVPTTVYSMVSLTLKGTPSMTPLSHV